MERPVDVDVDDPPPLGVIDVDESALATDAGVVDQDPDRPERRRQRLSRDTDRARVGDVGDERHRPESGGLESVDGRRETALDPVETAHDRPVLGQASGRGQTDPAGRAGDQGDPTQERTGRRHHPDRRSRQMDSDGQRRDQSRSSSSR